MLGLFRVSVRVKIRVKVSDPSSPIVRELVFSLTRLSFPLVRFRHNHVWPPVIYIFLDGEFICSG